MSINQLVISGTEATMTTVEIVNIINENRGNEKPILHKNLMRDIRDSLEVAYLKVYGTGLKFELSEFKDKSGKRNPCYILNKSQALFVVSGKNAVVRAVVQKRMEDLTTELAEVPKLNDSQLLDLMIEDRNKTKLILEQKDEMIALQAPKVEFHDVVAASKNTMLVEDAAKALGTSRNKLFAFLRESNWVFKRNPKASNRVYQAVIDAGYMDQKVVVIDKGFGFTEDRHTPLITGKGLIRLQKMLSKVR